MRRAAAPLLPGLALLVCTSLQSAEFEAPLRWGLQGTAARPAQDFRTITIRTGTGGGLFFERNQEGGWALRTRLDYLTFREDGTRSASSLLAPRAVKVSADQASVAVEARKGLAGDRGPFALGGLVLTRLEFGTVGPVPSGAGIGWGKEKTSVKAGFALGAGWRFTDAAAATLRFTTVSIGGLGVGTFEAGVEYRF